MAFNKVNEVLPHYGVLHCLSPLSWLFFESLLLVGSCTHAVDSRLLSRLRAARSLVWFASVNCMVVLFSPLCIECIEFQSTRKSVSAVGQVSMFWQLAQAVEQTSN